MKKASIMISCILIALVVIAGCSNQSPFPKVASDISVKQIDDFLVGQLFDASKFEVKITYLDGSVGTDEAALISLDETSKGVVNAGSTVTASLATSNGVLKSGPVTVSAYEINRIEIAGKPETVSSKTPSEALYKVNAYYFDKTNTEKVMPLGSTEFDVSADYGTLSATMPQLPATVTVKPLVGCDSDEQGNLSVSYETTAVYTASSEVTGPIASIESIVYKPGKNLLKVNYGEVPVPSFDDFDITVKYEGSDEAVKLTENPGFAFEYLDANGLPLDVADFTKGGTVTVKVTYGTIEKTADCTPSDFTLTIRKSASNDNTFVVGQPLEEPSMDDYVVEIKIGEKTTRLSADDPNLELVYFDGKDEYLGTIVPATLNIYPTYYGLRGTTNYYIDLKPDSTVTPVSITAELAADLSSISVPAKQYYKTLPNDTLAESMIDSDSVVIMGSDGQKITGTASYKFSLTNDKFTALNEGATEDTTTGYDVLLDRDEIYIEVSYTDSAENTVAVYVPVALAEPAVKSVTLNMDYAAKKGTSPLYKSDINWTVTSMTAKNNGEYVEYEAPIDTTVYGILVDGVPGELPKTADKAAKVSIYLIADPSVESDEKTVAVGEDYIPENQVRNIKVGLKAEKTLSLLVGDNLSNKLSSALADFEATGYTSAKGAATGVTVKSFAVPSKQLATETNKVNAVVSFVNEKGETVDDVLVPVTVNAAPYIALTGSSFTLDFSDTVKGIANNGNLVAGAYSFPSITASTYTAYCDEETPSSDIFSIKAVITRGEQTIDWTSGSQSLQDGDSVTFTISYMSATEAVKAEPKLTEATIAISVEAAE